MNWLLAACAAALLAVAGWIGVEWQQGRQAKVDLKALQDAQTALTTSLQQAAVEAESLRTKMGEISNSYEVQKSENASRAATSRATVRAVVSNTPSLAAGRVPREFVELFNRARNHDTAVGTTAGRSAGEPASAVPPRD